MLSAFTEMLAEGGDDEHVTNSFVEATEQFRIQLNEDALKSHGLSKYAMPEAQEPFTLFLKGLDIILAALSENATHFREIIVNKVMFFFNRRHPQ